MRTKALIACLCAALLLIPLLTTRAAAAVLSAPDTAFLSAQGSEADVLYLFSAAAPEAAAYEDYRREAYAVAAAQYTDAQIAASRESWLLRPVVLVCEAAGETGEAVPVCAVPPEKNGEIAVSLTSQILPALAAADRYEAAGFSFSLRFYIAAEIDGTYQPLSDRTAAVSLGSPATVRVDYVLPAGTDNGGNPAFLFAPFTETIPLENPTLRGHVFTGWQTESGIYVDTLQPGLSPLRLYARFTPCVYRINYILTTRPGYAFSRVSNEVNAKSYVYGTGTPLYDLRAPVGYTFAGWYRDAAFSGLPVTAVGADETGDVLLYAKWLTEAEARDAELRAAGWGDLDNDGDVSAADARLALRVAVGLETLTPERLARADFARLGRLTAANARTLLRISVGLDSLYDILKEHGRI